MNEILSEIAYSEGTFYEAWQRSWGVPVYRGHFIEDLCRLALGEWPRFGGRGAFVNLNGAGRSCDAVRL